MMRQGAVQAVHHAAHRMAFGRLLVEQPLMQAVLADLVIEAEAATALVMRVARAFDGGSAEERAFARIGAALAKFWVTKRLPNHAYEALECFGGNGFVEDSQMPRLYREAPVNAIWEGSGNVNALDLLRALGREPATRAAFFAEIAAVRGGHAGLDRSAAALESALADADEGNARRLAEEMAVLLQAALLVRHGPAEVADAFVAAAGRDDLRALLPEGERGLEPDPARRAGDQADLVAQAEVHGRRLA
jgi:putative acyl-CoA dehydrogenase